MGSKVVRSITIDYDVSEWLRNQGGRMNVSSEINSFLRRMMGEADSRKEAVRALEDLENRRKELDIHEAMLKAKLETFQEQEDAETNRFLERVDRMLIHERLGYPEIHTRFNAEVREVSWDEFREILGRKGHQA